MKIRQNEHSPFYWHLSKLRKGNVFSCLCQSVHRCGVPYDHCGPLQTCSFGKASGRYSTERPSSFLYKSYLVKVLSVVFRQIIGKV